MSASPALIRASSSSIRRCCPSGSRISARIFWKARSPFIVFCGVFWPPTVLHVPGTLPTPANQPITSALFAYAITYRCTMFVLNSINHDAVDGFFPTARRHKMLLLHCRRLSLIKFFSPDHKRPSVQMISAHFMSCHAIKQKSQRFTASTGPEISAAQTSKGHQLTHQGRYGAALPEQIAAASNDRGDHTPNLNGQRAAG